MVQNWGTGDKRADILSIGEFHAKGNGRVAQRDRRRNKIPPCCVRADGVCRALRANDGGALRRKVQNRLPHRRAYGAALAFAMVVPLGEHVCGAQQQGQREHRAKTEREESSETEGREEGISYHTCFQTTDRRRRLVFRFLFFLIFVSACSFCTRRRARFPSGRAKRRSAREPRP